MSLALILAFLTLGGGYLASRTPSEKELVDSFSEAQRFYAEGAYDQAIGRYEWVAKVRSRALDAQNIQVVVGEQDYPIQEAAVYQIGNASSKLYADYARFATDTDDEGRRRQYRALADESLARAVAAFGRIIDTATSEVLKGQAHGRLIEIYFEAEDYPAVVEAADRLIAAYPEATYAIEGYYNKGWAYYEMQQYLQAVEAFEALFARFPNGYRADRSLFQIGECYLALGEYEKAIEPYRRLVQRQRVEELSAEDLKRIKREKLAGLVDETALELAAKAEIRVGTCYTKLGRFEDGIAAYRRVISLFGTERQLVEEAYLRMADLYQEKGDTEAAVRTYREAIDTAADRTLKARIQYALAERYFGQARYEEAVAEYRVYLQGYGDITTSAGFSADRVAYRIGSAYQQLAQRQLDQGVEPTQVEWLPLAIAQYDSLCADESSPYFLDAYFNRALAWQTLATPQASARAVEAYERILAEDREPLYVQRALLQLAQLHADAGRHAEAAARASQLLERFPDGNTVADARMRLALALQAMGRLEEAAEQFLAVPPASAYFARSRLGAGHAYLNVQRYADAGRVLAEGLGQAAPDQRAGYRYLMAQASSGLGDRRQALEHYTAALQQPLDRTLEEAIRINRGNTAFQIGDYALGEADFRWVIDHVEDPEKVQFARDALTLAYLRQNRGGAAIEVLEQMLAGSQSAARRAELLGRIMDLYYAGDDFERTAHFAGLLLAEDFADGPTDDRPYGLADKARFLLGDALMRLNRPAEGMAVFAEALAQNPDSYFAANMRLNQATYYFSQGRYEEARDGFIALLEAGVEPQQETLTRFYLANAHYSLREFEPALRLFEGLLEAGPDEQTLPDILFGLGESHYQLGQFGEAIAYYRRLLDEFPDEPSADDAQYNLAWCLIELEREPEAVGAFGRLLERYPDSELAASAQFSLGDYAYNRGEYAEALEAYQAVATKYPQAAVADQVPRLLTELNEAVAYQYYERGLALMDSAETRQDPAYFERAIEVFEEVQERFPGTESELGALSNKGVCLEELGKWREAVAVYDEVIARYEDKKATQEAYQFAKSHREWIVASRL